MGVLPVLQLPPARVLTVRMAQLEHAQRRRPNPADYRLLQLASTSLDRLAIPDARISSTSWLIRSAARLDQPPAILATYEQHARPLDILFATILPGLLHPDLAPGLSAVFVGHLPIGGRHRCCHRQPFALTHHAFDQPDPARIAQTPWSQAPRIIDGLG